MYSHQIKEMVKALREAGIVQGTRVVDTAAEEVLTKYWQDKIALTWTADDVIERAGSMDVSLTEDEANDILGRAFHRYDCSIGITWDTFDYYIDEIASEKKEDEDEENRRDEKNGLYPDHWDDCN
jgi:hypothetical protein